MNALTMDTMPARLLGLHEGLERHQDGSTLEKKLDPGYVVE